MKLGVRGLAQTTVITTNTTQDMGSGLLENFTSPAIVAQIDPYLTKAHNRKLGS